MAKAGGRRRRDKIAQGTELVRESIRLAAAPGGYSLVQRATSVRLCQKTWTAGARMEAATAGRKRAVFGSEKLAVGKLQRVAIGNIATTRGDNYGKH